MELGNQLSPEAAISLMVDRHFPNGDPLFYEITAAEMVMYNKKNKDYAGGAEGETSDPNGNFERCAAFWSMYPGISLGDPRVVALSHMLKQLDQICWSLSRGYEGEVEGLDPRFMDVHIYAKIARVINQNMVGEAKKTAEESTLRYPNPSTAVTIGVPGNLKDWEVKMREANTHSGGSSCCVDGQCTCR